MAGEVKDGCLYVVATPIGNLEDLGIRALRVLREVALIAAEDTRKAQILLKHYEITTRTTSLFEGNEAMRSEKLIARLKDGDAVALISEAGMPGISDPGAILIRRCIAEEIEIDVIPGPSAVTTALVLSGLPAERFLWLGFLPRRGKARQHLIDQLRRSPTTAVLFESPNRTRETLAELAAALGGRDAAMTRELSKLYQDVVRLPLHALAEYCREHPPRGEITLVISGAPEASAMDETALREAITQLLSEGRSVKDVADTLSSVASRREVYQLALSLAKR